MNMFLRSVLLAFLVWLWPGLTAAQVVVQATPPIPIVEHPASPPGPGYVWLGGYYRWNGVRYVWVPGHYATPPRPDVQWVPAHWVTRNGGWVFVEGHWRSFTPASAPFPAPPPPASAIIRVPPPPVVIEHPGPPPGPRYVWNGGYYRWNGVRYIWVPGHYVLPPRRGVIWVPGHWVQRGGGWMYIDGYWK